MEKKQYAVELDMNGAEVTYLAPGPYDKDVFFIAQESDEDRFEKDPYDGVYLIDATEDEQTQWQVAHGTLRLQLDAIEAEVLRARDAWEAAKEKAEEARETAWSRYLPVQTEIERRMDEVAEQRAQEMERRAKDIAEKEARVRAEEDVLLGAREFLVTRPRLRGQDGRNMDVPTIHLVDCASTKRMKRLPEPVRIADAFEALMDGGTPYTKHFYSWEPRATEQRLFGEVCTRCGVEEKFIAEYPETYLEWRARAEAVQPQLPRDTWTANEKFFADLGLVQAIGKRADGYVRASVKEQEFQHKKLLTPDEGLLCWTDGEFRRADEEKLGALIDALYENGMIGRRLEEDKSFVVFRRMTKGELRAKAEKVTG